MEQETSPPVASWRFVAVAAGAAAVVTIVLVFVSYQLTPSCGGPWCLTGLLYFPISAIGAAIVALVVARSARRSYLVGLLAGVGGYAAAWFWLLEGGGLRLMA